MYQSSKRVINPSRIVIVGAAFITVVVILGCMVAAYIADTAARLAVLS